MELKIVTTCALVRTAERSYCWTCTHTRTQTHTSTPTNPPPHTSWRISTGSKRTREYARTHTHTHSRGWRKLLIDVFSTNGLQLDANRARYSETTYLLLCVTVLFFISAVLSVIPQTLVAFLVLVLFQNTCIPQTECPCEHNGETFQNGAVVNTRCKTK